MKQLEIIERRPSKASEKPPLLFIHGAFTNAECWKEYYLDYFAKNGYHAVALSLRGHGKSWGSESLYSFGIDDYVKDVTKTVAGFKKEPVLIGHSMGGLVVQNYLKLPGSRAGAAILMASVPPEGLARSGFTMMMQYPASTFKLQMINALPRSMWKGFVSENEIRDIFFSETTSTESVLKFMPMFQHESPLAIFEMTFFDMLEAKKIKLPMLVMGAEKDIIIPPGFVQFTASVYQTSPVILENEGHAIMLSDCWQKSADIIIRWLDENGFR